MQGHIPDRFKVSYTTITYPAWNDLRGSLTALQIQFEDTLSDLISLAWRGDPTTTRRQRVADHLDWGQTGLDTLHTIALADIVRHRSSPLPRWELRKDQTSPTRKSATYPGARV